MNATFAPPMTWLDVARLMAGTESRQAAAELSLSRARASWFGVFVEGHKKVSDDALATWLEKAMPGRVALEPLRIRLEGPSNIEDLPISFEVVEVDGRHRPSFGIVDGTVDFGCSPARAATRPVPVSAAISVKGGTGRTTIAVALALHWAKATQKPVLLIDADLEAPGISYLYSSTAGEAKISLEDVIALAHAEEDPTASGTIEYASDKLRDHLVSGNVFILPLRRDLDELSSSSVRPEHLSTPDQPYAMADLISRIAQKLGCCGVVFDVRAGLVPIGVNLAMDPDVAPLFVTTLSSQALRATGSLISFIAREMRLNGSILRRPLLAINRVPALFRQTGMDQRLIEPLNDSVLRALVSDYEVDTPPSAGIFDNSDELDPYAQIEIPEIPDLQVSLAGWNEYVEQLGSSGILALLAPTLDQWLVSDASSTECPAVEATPIAPSETDSRRAQLSTFAESLISAETVNGPISKPLVTRPLAALTQRFQSEVPIAVSEGAKGTGKTLAARYFIAQTHWETVVSELVDRRASISAVIIPVCASIQSSSSYLEQVDQARETASSLLDLGQPQKVYATSEYIKSQLTLGHSEQRWVDIWLDAIAWSSGFHVSVEGAGSSYVEHLRKEGQSVVALLEGLEELYTSVDDQGVRVAMRAAIVSLPQRLRSEVRRPVGLVVFARRDTVEAAVAQNLDQYRREYAPFALTWTDDDVLELAAWLATQASALPGLWTTEFGTLPQEEKESRLEALWGRKLGPDDEPGRRIREAYTATWIIAVLSDLRARLVPRDLIRLLSSAAKVPLTPDEKATYKNRLLIPRALKAAIEPTSEKKVKESEEEIRELEPIFAKFRLQADKLSVPLDQDSINTLGVTALEVETLKRHGIVFGDAAPYEVPELFRRGLRLRHAGARRSVVNLYRRAKQV